MHQGVRTTQHSLANCVECHASRETGRVTGGKDAFCEGCHRYAAVKLDCFECHADRPEAGCGGGDAMSNIDTGRRKFLAWGAALAGVTLAPGITLFELAQGRPPAEPASGKVRWGMLIDTNRCATDCDDCVTACDTRERPARHEDARRPRSGSARSSSRTCGAGKTSRRR